MTDPGFQLSLEDLPSLRDRYQDCTETEKQILNQVTHDSSVLRPAESETLPSRYDQALTSLEEAELLDAGVDDEYVVPPDLLFLPDGPGRRLDQFSGVLHRLPESVVRRWLAAWGQENVDELETLAVYRRLASEVIDAEPDGSVREELNSVFDGGSWRPKSELPFDLPDSLDEVFGDLNPSETPFHEGLLTGFLLPVWNDSLETTGVFRSDNPETSDVSVAVAGSDHGDANEKNWDRSPFDFPEQLKISLIVNDALPLRLTEDNSPHRFDLKEAARITDWSLAHVDFLTKYLIERDLLGAEDDRYFITDRFEEWEQGSPLINALFTGLVPEVDVEEPVATQHTDFSFGLLLQSLLRVLGDNGSGVDLETDLNGLVELPEVRAVVAARSGFVNDYDRARRTLVEEAFERLYRIGLCDRFEDQHRYRINDRGERLLRNRRLGIEPEEDLPLILQPDGQLMLPLECPLESFRHVNPFGLIVKVDRMIVYQIDDKSLVQALNDGWDAQGFREFLEENVRELPNPMEELFDDILDDVEDVSIDQVHHLLEFETGATAAKAMNLLNNYEPSRIDECTVVLRSKTTEETIRRNLSRGGIRLRQEGSRGVLSPISDSG